MWADMTRVVSSNLYSCPDPFTAHSQLRKKVHIECKRKTCLDIFFLKGKRLKTTHSRSSNKITEERWMDSKNQKKIHV
jgi:hypothetical protein